MDFSSGGCQWKNCALAARLSKFEVDSVHRAGIRNQAADAVSQLETGGTNTTKLGVDLPEILVSIIYHRGSSKMIMTETPLKYVFSNRVMIP